MIQKFIFKTNGKVFIKIGRYEEIMKKYKPEWIDCWYEWEKE